MSGTNSHQNDPISIGQLGWGPLPECQNCHTKIEDEDNIQTHEPTGEKLCPDCYEDYIAEDEKTFNSEFPPLNPITMTAFTEEQLIQKAEESTVEMARTNGYIQAILDALKLPEIENSLEIRSALHSLATKYQQAKGFYDHIRE